MSNVQLKPENQGDPWLVVDHTSDGELRASLADYMGDEFPSEEVSTPHLVALAQAWWRRNLALAQVVAPAVPDNVTQLPTASEQPVQQGGGTSGLKFWTIPDPKNAQYKLLLFSWDYIPDKATRDAINADLKKSNPQTYAKPFDTNSSPWVWGAKSNAEQAIRKIFAEHGVS